MKLRVNSQYRQIWLYELREDVDPSLGWDPRPFRDRIAPSPGVVAVGTGRVPEVVVSVEVLEEPPPAGSERFDHVTEASIDVETGTLLLKGPTDTSHDAPRIHLAAGEWRVRASHKGVGTEEETIRLQLWPAPYAEPIVLERWSPTV